MPAKDITGVQYGYLTAVRPLYKYYCGKTQEWVWEAKCICGNSIEKRIGQLTTGDNKSCGCMSSKMKSESKLAEKNPNWSGDDVGRVAVHSWINKTIKKPELCEVCNLKKSLDLSNISDVYNKKTYTRDLKNWRWLCRKCHMKTDGRLGKLISRNKTSGGTK